MSVARYVVGNSLDVLATIPTGTVDLVLTSPPFLALRSYLPDKFRPATSDVVIACTSRTRYFDLDAVRSAPARDYAGMDPARNGRGREFDRDGTIENHTRTAIVNPAGAPPLDTWVIPTAPYAGSHYATFPPALAVRPILAMSPERVCQECGEPSRRVVAGAHLPDDEATGETVGWTDCGHDQWRRGLVLDPFAGSGTTLAVATGNGRDAIGIDLDERNAALALERVGPMFLTVDHHTPTQEATA